MARAAGTSRPLVHAYFGDRRGLIDAIQIRVIRRLDDWVAHGLQRATTPRGRVAALVDGVFSFVEQEGEAWRLLTSSGGLDHPLLHRLRHRWAEAVAGGDPALLLAAEAVVAALVLATGGWTSAGVEPSDVTRVLAEVVEPRRTRPTGPPGAVTVAATWQDGAMAKPPAMEIDTNTIYTVTLGTPKGAIVMDLDPRLAPNSVNHFVVLARQGFYTGLTFHRVVPGFVIQGGDPEGSGRGGPGYRWNDEPVKAEYTVGAVALANAGPNTNGSQFFICIDDCTRKLDKLYNLFGYVTQGVDVAQAIGVGDTIDTVEVTERPAA